MTRWPQLEQFLATDPRDVGCEQAMNVLHIYVDMLALGDDPETEYPGIAAHLSACAPCNGDLQGLLQAARAGQQ
jgi:hypothetical protein